MKFKSFTNFFMDFNLPLSLSSALQLFEFYLTQKVILRESFIYLCGKSG